MHDIHSFTVGLLDWVLTSLEERGFRFVRLDDMGAFPVLNQAMPYGLPAGPSVYGGQHASG